MIKKAHSINILQHHPSSFETVAFWQYFEVLWYKQFITKLQLLLGFFSGIAIVLCYSYRPYWPTWWQFNSIIDTLHVRSISLQRETYTFLFLRPLSNSWCQLSYYAALKLPHFQSKSFSVGNYTACTMHFNSKCCTLQLVFGAEMVVNPSLYVLIIGL